MITTAEANINAKKTLFEFKNIKAKLMFNIFAFFIVGRMALTDLNGFMASNALTSSIIDTINSIGLNTATKIEIVNAVAGDIITLLSFDIEVISALSSWNEGTLTEQELFTVSGYLTDIRDKTSHIFEDIHIIDNQITVIASTTPSNIGRDYSHSDIFLHQEKGTYTGQPIRGIGNIPYFVYARPVYDDNGQQIGFLYFSLSIQNSGGYYGSKTA